MQKQLSKYTIEDFADRLALQGHAFTQRVINMVQLKQKLAQKRHQAMLQKYGKKIPGTQKSMKSDGPELSNQSEPESKIARINRIREAMLNKQKTEEDKKLEEIQILQHFSNELRPQILKKYPHAPMEKVNKVIMQKWETIDPAKKLAYIQKVKNKIELLKLRSLEPEPIPIQNQDEEPETETEAKHEYIQPTRIYHDHPVKSDNPTTMIGEQHQERNPAEHQSINTSNTQSLIMQQKAREDEQVDENINQEVKQQEGYSDEQSEGTQSMQKDDNEEQ